MMSNPDCSHCGLPLGSLGEVIPGPTPDLNFCCPGCAAAHDLVAGLGLDQYYQRRVLDNDARRIKPDDSQDGLEFSLYVEEKESPVIPNQPCLWS